MKSETGISDAYGTGFVSPMASIVFYSASLSVLCLDLSYFTYESEAIGFFHKRFKFLPNFSYNVA